MDGRMLLLDNTQKVGRNCHTFVEHSDGRPVRRLKLYGKFP
jgi:hypothetical protein